MIDSPYDASSPSEQYRPLQQPTPPGLATASFVCGLIACILNGLFITSLFGFILGILAVAFSLAVLKHKEARSGLVLGLISFMVLAIWICSFLIIISVDPTFSFQ